jgi:two-component system, OmpR family, alkaline phosphatase synthesis response regulator PhoP
MSRMPKVLLVDDDEDILDLLVYNLTREGFDIRSVSNSKESILIANEFLPDLVVLDLMMPDINGIEVCRQIRKNELLKNIYIFFLTAKSDDYYKHATFNVGGDEFIEKVMGIKPLIHKIQAVLKKNFIIRKQKMKFKIGSLELFRGAETVYKNGSKVNLNKAEFEILFFLAQNAGKQISIDEIIQTLWGSNTFMDSKSVKGYLANIQHKIGEESVREKIRDCYYFVID